MRLSAKSRKINELGNIVMSNLDKRFDPKRISSRWKLCVKVSFGIVVSLFEKSWSLVKNCKSWKLGKESRSLFVKSRFSKLGITFRKSGGNVTFSRHDWYEKLWISSGSSFNCCKKFWRSCAIFHLHNYQGLCPNFNIKATYNCGNKRTITNLQTCNAKCDVIVKIDPLDQTPSKVTFIRIANNAQVGFLRIQMWYGHCVTHTYVNILKFAYDIFSMTINQQVYFSQSFFHVVSHFKATGYTSKIRAGHWISQTLGSLWEHKQ